MIVWGKERKTAVIGSGEFYCPTCGARRNFLHKNFGESLSVYFITLFQYSSIEAYVECQTCFAEYEPGILQCDPAAGSEVAPLRPGIAGLLERGASIQEVYRDMIRTGTGKEAAKAAIAAVTLGRTKKCRVCELEYLDSLKFCAACGVALDPC